MKLDTWGPRFTLGHGSPTFVWQRATPVIVGWFGGSTWKNNNKWYTLTCLNYCEMFIVYT